MKTIAILIAVMCLAVPAFAESWEDILDNRGRTQATQNYYQAQHAATMQGFELERIGSRTVTDDW